MAKGLEMAPYRGLDETEGEEENGFRRGGIAKLAKFEATTIGRATESRTSKRGSLLTDNPVKAQEQQKLISMAAESVDVYRGRFSWVSAFFMCLFMLTGFASLILFVLSTQNSLPVMVSQEISYIDAPNPVWVSDNLQQPNGATSRKIGQPFNYELPQAMIFYSFFSASIGLFTVSFYCSQLLMQDIGVFRVKMMGEVINRGVNTFLQRTVPPMLLIMLFIAGVLWWLSGLTFVIAMLVGGITALICANLGISMNFQGGPRLTHALNNDLVESLNMGIRTGAIGGLAAHAMAQLGVVSVWVLGQDARALIGFGCGTSIVAFYNRIGGGIFSKGSDIGSDFVSAMIGEDVDDYKMDHLSAVAKDLADKDGDGEVDEDYARHLTVDPNQKMDDTAGFYTQEEAAMRTKMDEQMEATIRTMHPVNYLDAIGENIADVGGTSSDLFETMVMTLACSVNFGARAHESPYLGTSLPFNIISTGTICCSIASYYVWCHERHSSHRIRWSLRLNLLFVMVMVQCAVCVTNYWHWSLWHTMDYTRMVNYDVIVALGLLAPEICAYICEFFTSVNFPPVRWLASNAKLGMIQVILQGMGQGFVSAGLPSTVNIIVQVVAFELEGFYGLILLACASQACTGWQATLAAYGAVANNANRIVHLTTINEVAHHRANVCGVIGTTTSHNGKCVAGQNAFFATSALIASLLAEKYTSLGQNFQATVGQELSNWTRAGLLAGIIFTLLFLANTLTSCIRMAKRLVEFCKDNEAVAPRKDKAFPATHINPLKILVAFAAVESFQLTLAPMIQTAAAPLVIGQLFGFKGLLALVSGGNSVCFSLNLFLVNSGQAWDAARKFVLFGMLRDEKGNTVSVESDVYYNLGIGEQIGGPLEDLAGPGLNNFIKFVAVIAFVTIDIYDEFPTNSWPYGILQVVINFALVSFFRFGLSFTIRRIDLFFARRRAHQDFEEGTTLLREMEAHEKRLALARAEGAGDELELEAF